VLIDLNKAGEHNPEVLCDQALKAFREPPPAETAVARRRYY
jgi:hypothetical protein